MARFSSVDAADSLQCLHDICRLLIRRFALIFAAVQTPPAILAWHISVLLIPRAVAMASIANVDVVLGSCL